MPRFGLIRCQAHFPYSWQFALKGSAKKASIALTQIGLSRAPFRWRPVSSGTHNVSSNKAPGRFNDENRRFDRLFGVMKDNDYKDLEKIILLRCVSFPGDRQAV
jgi:hypothetical protein